MYSLPSWRNTVHASASLTPTIVPNALTFRRTESVTGSRATASALRAAAPLPRKSLSLWVMVEGGGVWQRELS